MQTRNKFKKRKIYILNYLKKYENLFVLKETSFKEKNLG